MPGSVASATHSALIGPFGNTGGGVGVGRVGVGGVGVIPGGVPGVVPGIASGRSPPGCSPPTPGGWVPGGVGSAVDGVEPGGTLPGGIVPSPGGIYPKSDGPPPSVPEEDEQAMRAIANPTRPNPAENAFTIGSCASSGRTIAETTGRSSPQSGAYARPTYFSFGPRKLALTRLFCPETPT